MTSQTLDTARQFTIQENFSELSAGAISRDSAAIERLSRIVERGNAELNRHISGQGESGTRLAKIACSVAVECHRELPAYKHSSFKLFHESGLTDFMQRLSVAAQQDLHTFTPRALASMMWAWAKLRQTDEQLFQGLAEQTVKQIKDFNRQDLANTVWACAHLGFRNIPLLTAIEGRALHLISSLKDQDVSNITCAVEALNYDSPQLIRSLAGRLRVLLPEAKPQAVANTATALAKTRFRDSATADAIAREVAARPTSFSAQDIAQTIWAIALIGPSMPENMAPIYRHVQLELRAFSPVELSTIAWSTSMLRTPNSELLSAMAPVLAEKLERLQPRSVANSVMAYSKRGVRSLVFFDAVTEYIQRHVNRLNSIDVATFTFALAELSIPHTEALSLLAGQGFKLFDTFSDYHRSVTAWGLSLAAPELVKYVCTEKELATIQDRAAFMRAYQALIVSGDISPRHTFAQIKEYDQQSADLQDRLRTSEIYRWLIEDVGISESGVKVGCLIQGVPADFVVSRGQRQVVVERMLKRHHYTSGPDAGPLRGSSIMRQRFFERCGYKSLEIHDEDFRSGYRNEVIKRLDQLLRASDVSD